MPALKGKLEAYAQGRAQGMRPKDAASYAGYSINSVHVASSRAENNMNVKARIKELKAGENAAVEVAADDSVEGWALKDRYSSSLELLRDVYNNPKAPKSIRYQAAKDALPYEHARKEGGKKEEAGKAAKATAEASRFSTAPAPRGPGRPRAN